MSKDLLLFPFGGNAREALGLIQGNHELAKQWNVLGFIDEEQSMWGQQLNSVKVLGGMAEIQKHASAKILAVVGNPNNYTKRKEIISKLNMDDADFASVVHPSVTISPDATIGCNVLIMPNVVIGAGVVIGNHCIVLPNTTINHDVSVGDYCCVGGNVAISGGVEIKENCYIGSRVSIRENIKIGQMSLIGIGSNVVSDIAQKSVVGGNPAKKMRDVI